MNKIRKMVLIESDVVEHSCGLVWNYANRDRTRYVEGKKVTREYWINIQLTEEQLSKVKPKISRGGKQMPNTSLNNNRLSVCFTDVFALKTDKGSLNYSAKGMQPLRACVGIILGRADEDVLYSMVNGLVDYAKYLEKSIQMVEESTDELWNKLLERFDSDEIQQLLQSIRIGGGDMLDHQFSQENKLRALAQSQKNGIQPTYLATEKQWQSYGRVLKNGATAFLLYCGSGSLNKDTLSQNLNALGYNSESELSKKSVFQHRAVDIKSRDFKGYVGWAKYYDVSETIPTSKDKWGKEVGFKDNLNGIPNEVSDVRIDDDSNEKLSNALFDGKKQNEHLKFVDAISKVAQSFNVPIANPTSDDEKSCAAAANVMIRDIVTTLIPKQLNLVKKTDPKFMQIVNALTMMIMCMCQFAPTLASIPSMPSEAKGMRKLFVMVCNAIRKELGNTNSNTTNESIISMALSTYLLQEGFGSGDFNQDFIDLYTKMTGEEYYEENDKGDEQIYSN